MNLEKPEPVPEPEPEKTVLACPTYSCGDLADFQCSRGKRVVKFELEKTEFALFPSLIHQVWVAADRTGYSVLAAGRVQHAHVRRPGVAKAGLPRPLLLLRQREEV